MPRVKAALVLLLASHRAAGVEATNVEAAALRRSTAAGGEGWSNSNGWTLDLTRRRAAGGIAGVCSSGYVEQLHLNAHNSLIRSIPTTAVGAHQADRLYLFSNSSRVGAPAVGAHRVGCSPPGHQLADRVDLGSWCSPR